MANDIRADSGRVHAVVSGRGAKRIVFLDVDGVLINLACFSLGGAKRSGSHSQAHPDCVRELNRITDTTGARIVVSSVWRHGGLKRIRDILRSWGVTGKVIGITPDLCRAPKDSAIIIATERGDEIQAWLDTTRFNVETFVILDDDADMKHLKPRLIQSTFEKGLTPEHADRAIALLEGEAR